MSVLCIPAVACIPIDRLTYSCDSSLYLSGVGMQLEQNSPAYSAMIGDDMSTLLSAGKAYSAPLGTSSALARFDANCLSLKSRSEIGASLS